MSTATQLQIQGMHCVNCARGVENILREAGALDVSVDFATATAAFQLADEATLPAIEQAVTQAGYKVLHSVDGQESAGQSFWSLETKFFFCLLFTIPLMLHMLVDWHLLHNAWAQLALTTPVLILGLIHFGRSALISIRAQAANMDVLIVISIVAAFIYSVTGLLAGLGSDYLFFETSATITTIVLLGNLLESRAILKTTSSIRELSKLRVTRAIKVLRSGSTEILQEINATSISVGDELRVNSGDQVPADGVVISGTGEVDEAMITGESLPILKNSGDRVIGGTVLLRGSLNLQADATGQHTVLAQLIRLVQEAHRNKPAIQRIGDKVSEVFVPAVLIVSVLTLLLSIIVGLPFGTALLRAIAVLVVACPCAMGLATPTAVMVGIGKAARQGILLRGGQTLETMASLESIVFDKTGTLTTGEFIVSELKTLSISADAAKKLILGLELHSSHPLAKSIVKQWTSTVEPQVLSQVKETIGLGMTGIDQSGSVYTLVAARHAPSQEFSDSDLLLLKDQVVIAAIKLADSLKPEALAAVQSLMQLGLHPVLLSGDKHQKCLAVAKALGIEEVYSQQTPQQKLELLANLESKQPRAYVGDGINDAPALSKARIGISLSNGSQIAVQSAQVILLNGKLNLLVEAIKISRRTLSTIKQNLFWAFFYNVLMIPLAACGYLTPTLAALSMAFSDVVVIANSLRLRIAR